MEAEWTAHTDVEKVEAFLATLLSEQTGPLTELQRDFLISIRSAIPRIEISMNGFSRDVTDEESPTPDA